MNWRLSKQTRAKEKENITLSPAALCMRVCVSVSGGGVTRVLRMTSTPNFWSFSSNVACISGSKGGSQLFRKRRERGKEKSNAETPSSVRPLPAQKKIKIVCHHEGTMRVADRDKRAGWESTSVTLVFEKRDLISAANSTPTAPPPAIKTCLLASIPRRTSPKRANCASICGNGGAGGE